MAQRLAGRRPYALRLYAGASARRLMEREGLQAHHIGVIPAAAGGPKGLVLGPLDRFIFGDWLPTTTHPVHLVGASIGAWRMATACLPDPAQAFARLSHDYIHQHYETPAGHRRPRPQDVSASFGRSLRQFYDGHVAQLLRHPRYRLHVVTSRGRHLLRRDGRWRTPLGYLVAGLTNLVNRRAMGAWLERVVFSTPGAELPFGVHDYRTRQVELTETNFADAVQASCSIPFALQPVQGIAGAPPGAYWDGGITDYHLHLDFRVPLQTDGRTPAGLVLYPHFQRRVVPGWLDKHLFWRHRATAFLDHALVLAPDPQWVAGLPRGKLPDRHDFVYHAADLPARVRQWTAAVSASEQLADEFRQWLHQPDLSRLEAL